MGILNVTPDSFSDGGRYNRLDAAVRRAVEMVEEGADMIDIGGESTRPGAVPLSLEEELERVIPVVERVAREVDVPISVDTYKAEVARQALEAGAHLINDVWGLKADPDMARVAAEYGAPVILMHNRHDRHYRNLMADIVADLRESI
ncbi:MAG: dihydropteroate synthase, partial [Calditerricola sp.]|nr:dihydropteroate synthase [Calditerricola sp.]